MPGSFHANMFTIARLCEAQPPSSLRDNLQHIIQVQVTNLETKHRSATHLGSCCIVLIGWQAA
jgi:hypothetical protein